MDSQKVPFALYSVNFSKKTVHNLDKDV